MKIIPSFAGELSRFLKQKSGLHGGNIRARCLRSLFVFLVAVLLVPCSWGQRWSAEGPGPNRHGQVENIRDGEVTGAIRTVATHPTKSAIVFAGTVNGGIWRTDNGDSSRPIWRQLTDSQKSLSIGALEFDPTDSSHQTLIAGTGRFSSFGDGGPLIGLLRTTDGGSNWSAITGAGQQLPGLNVSGVAPRGKIIVVSANQAEDAGNVGVWRTDNGGKSWKQISGDAATGLPSGASAGLAGDPADPSRLFANAGGAGLYRSTDCGASWGKISDSRMDGLIRKADNVKISVGNHDSLYAAIDVMGRLAGIFHSEDGGTSWKPMDLPGSDEGGVNPGGQGRTHLSLAADPADVNVVYVGGDRQPGKFINGVESDPARWPNSIGAMNFSGRIYRGDPSKPSGNQWVHITHSRDLGPVSGGTKNSSAPHADSRGMAVAANGALLEVDDGGMYRRTSPRTNSGDWFSMNGNLSATEFHSVAWDPVSHVIVGGAQDTGTPEQWPPSTLPWQSVSTSDGGIVAVSPSGISGYSLRYSSFYSLGGFRRQIYDSVGELQEEDFPQLTPLDNAPPLQPQFYTPVKINTIVPDRLILGGKNSVYESFDRGDTISEIGPGIAVTESVSNPVAYGAKGNPDMLYVGSGSQVYVRKSASPAALQPCASYSGDTIFGIAINPDEPMTAVLVSASAVYRTSNGGDNWIPITGNLLTLSPGVLRSVSYNPVIAAGAVVVGTDAGVFLARGPEFSKWGRLGDGLPNVPVYHIEYSREDRLYLAGTLGRGAWTLRSSGGVSAHSQAASRNRSGQAPGSVRQSGADPAADANQENQTGPAHVGPLAKSPDQFELSSGVIVDQLRGRLYAMNPDDGIHAFSILDGSVLWTTKDAAKPIGLVSGRLICQSDSFGSVNDVTIVVLEPETGKKIISNSASLPKDVVPSVTENRKGNFVASADSFNGSPVVSWQFVSRAQQGLPPRTKATLPGSGVAADVGPAEPEKGAFRIDLATGQISPVPAADVPALQPLKSENAPTYAKVFAATGRRYLSADGRSVLVIERSHEKSEAGSYTLTIFDSMTGTRLGTFKSAVPIVRFFVAGSRIIYESSRHFERKSTGLVEEPRRVIAFDLASGRDVWSVNLRNTEYVGPYPP